LLDKGLRDRIEAKITRQGQCWLWTGCMNGSKEMPAVRGPDGTMTSVRRLLYDDAHDGIGRAYVRNTCGNPRCVNPKHAEAIDALPPAERVRRMRARRKASPPRRKIDRVRELVRRCGLMLVKSAPGKWRLTKEEQWTRQ
jgi:hypothetical protein